MKVGKSSEEITGVKGPGLFGRRLWTKISIQNGNSDPSHVVNQADKLFFYRHHNKVSPLL